MKKFLVSLLVVISCATQSYAFSDAIAGKIADVLQSKIEADRDVAIAAIQESPRITIDGEVFNKVTIGEDVVLVGNAGVFLLGNVEIGSITNIVELKKNSIVIGNVGVTAGSN